MPRTTTPRKLADPEPGKPLGYGMGSLIWDVERPGRMILRYTHAGHRYAERGRSWAEVDGKRKARIAKLDERDGFTPGSVAALCEAWLAFWRREKGAALAYNTDVGYQTSIRHIVGQIGGLPAIELDRRRVRHMLGDLANEPHSLGRGTLAQVRYTLSMISEWGIDEKWLKVNSVRGVKLPEAAAKPRAKRWLDLEEYDKVRRFLVGDPSTIHTLYLVMLHCGLRPAEARGLRWDSIDFSARTLKVESAVRKDRNGKAGFSSTLKTDRHGDAAHRTIPMTPELHAVLRREMTAQGEGAGEYVFAGVGKSTFDTEAGRIAKAAGVRYVNPNGYRHTFASVCRHHGMPYEQLAKLMGHTSVRMIIDVYGHPLVDPRPVEMDAYLAGPGGPLPWLDDPEES